MANILIIDDDKSILRLLEFTLQRAGHAVLTYGDGVQGLAEAEAKNPDLIVVDVMMPKMTGYEFCRQARTKPNLKDIPIIMFSARFQPVDRQTALASGATDYLSKTTSPNDLLARISELLPAQTATTENSAIGLFSLRGGAGTTSLAVNLAAAFALTQKKPTALIDMAKLGGHTALMLGLRPTSSVSQALSTLREITPEAIKPHLVQHSSGVQLLGSALGYDHELHLTDKRLEPLVATIKSMYPYTILDVPHTLEAGFAPTMQLFSKILLVISPDMPALQSTAIALQGLARLGIPEKKIELIVNNTLPANALPLETIQKVVKRPIMATIPFEPEMTKAINSNKPLLLLNPNSPGAVAITKLANQLLTT
jgi:CheY-like chemotaxis protein/MinD-like ATPase involved in chromosome partitioning or flagellar assembly